MPPKRKQGADKAGQLDPSTRMSEAVDAARPLEPAEAVAKVATLLAPAVARAMTAEVILTITEEAIKGIVEKIAKDVTDSVRMAVATAMLTKVEAITKFVATEALTNVIVAAGEVEAEEVRHLQAAAVVEATVETTEADEAAETGDTPTSTTTTTRPCRQKKERKSDQ